MKDRYILLLILVFSIILRFLWFPKNVYFGYDQARDAIVSQEIIKNNDFKIIGPSAGKEGFYHGPLYWYLIGPVYTLFNGNPEYVLAFISLINALGIYLIFLLGKNLFSRQVGLVSAFLYSISFSQTQYSLYFANPSPAVLSIMMFYIGWALLFFNKNEAPLADASGIFSARFVGAKSAEAKNFLHLSPALRPRFSAKADKNWSWVLIGLGLGLSIQFEFFLIYLFSSVALFVVLFWNTIKKNFNYKYALLGLVSLFLSTFTFILAEVKYGFRTTKTLLELVISKNSSEPIVKLATSNFLSRLGTEVYYDNLLFIPHFKEIIALILLLLITLSLIKRKTLKKTFLFILVWIFSNLLLDKFGTPQLYYVGIGLVIPVLLFFAFWICEIFHHKKAIAVLILIILFILNIRLIKKYNPDGPVKDLYVQNGMLLSDEKMVVDEIFKEAEGKKFTVNALTMPYKIKTTWAYLFNWYGKQKYGYVPFWGGEDVPGYPGFLPSPDRRDYIRFAILEPMRGIPEELKREFTDSENGYSLPKSVMKIGHFEIEKRIP